MGCTYVRLVPLAEGGGVDLDDGALDQRVRSDELVVGSIVDLACISSDEIRETGENRRTTEMIRVLRVTCSDAQAKLPPSRRRARYLVLPPRVRTVWIRLAPSFVLAGWRPNSNFLFLR